MSAKVAALQAHATQVTVAPDRRSCALSNNIALPILDMEYYVLVPAPPGRGPSRVGNRPAGRSEPWLAVSRG